ncbi:tRNA (adenosine(37)-N6)-threonylcarbamoyltransferase complex dimerization subunit type 1 TsaB [Ferrimonas balearica]|uniref:tRNA (adenosine(37)-N6)-threonylcarbamoyltransferase complex dimerization subunit type 1 TsaB n=1 Tax=Ferrimonas balearica TaxID=44012 RepID=UPI001C99A24E|nr:tRNA (adenosine(37)-N6)-threonylcarbamoyltransferase complex dimerization subunit type 1 TsaB [Ferrimonas balearica]MBY5920598.1 tRNA (adenosine(37)-N6)-threonylcarbamoyltransferase complex dimerization subunit type 1 TsaB [Ferrimonas balearica]MBY5996717.1 tRNA (adenosine(37)-N6)-threonylcarbamoyltransferase complex dimerization subunit type 1 TsaB [Ferrimonas balearica]
MKILIIDTATENCSAALYLDGQISDQEQESPREHSQRLLPMVDTLMADAGMTLNQLDAIAFGRGPGSFTGIRIGTAMMQGLALGADLPVLPISNLAAMAQAAIAEGASEVVAAIDARMGEVYFGHFRAENGLAVLVGEEQVVAPEQLLAQWQLGDQVIAVGTGFEAYPELAADDRITVAEHLRLPTAKLMIPLAVSAFEQGQAMPVDEVEPVYLRNNVAWKKLPGRE